MGVPFPGGIVRMNPETRVVNVNWNNGGLAWLVIEAYVTYEPVGFNYPIPCDPPVGTLSSGTPYDANADVTFGYIESVTWDHDPANSWCVGFLADGTDVYPYTTPSHDIADTTETYASNFYITRAKAPSTKIGGSEVPSVPAFVTDYFSMVDGFKTGSALSVEWYLVQAEGGPECWLHGDGISRTILWTAGRASPSDIHAHDVRSGSSAIDTADIVVSGTVAGPDGDYEQAPITFEYVGAFSEMYTSDGDTLVRLLYRRKTSA